MFEPFYGLSNTFYGLFTLYCLVFIFLGFVIYCNGDFSYQETKREDKIIYWDSYKPTNEDDKSIIIDINL